MYIELFLLNNIIIDMIIIKLASAISGMSYSHIASLGMCIFQAIYSAFAVNNILLCKPLFKIILCILMTTPFWLKNKKQIISQAACIAIATVIAGGTAFMICAKTWIGAMLVPAIVLLGIIVLSRRIKLNKCKLQTHTMIFIRHNNTICENKAIIDSGDMLTEPVSGLPIILVHAPELAKYAEIPITYRDVMWNENTVYAFTAQEVRVGGIAINAMIAPISSSNKMPALVPYCAVYGMDIERKGV